MLLLKQNINRKKRVDKKVIKLEFETGNNKKYKVKAIYDNAVYTNKAKGYLRGLYYFVACKEYLKKENT